MDRICLPLAQQGARRLVTMPIGEQTGVVNDIFRALSCIGEWHDCVVGHVPHLCFTQPQELDLLDITAATIKPNAIEVPPNSSTTTMCCATQTYSTPHWSALAASEPHRPGVGDVIGAPV